jgi:hypothetical protein
LNVELFNKNLWKVIFESELLSQAFVEHHHHTMQPPSDL